MGEVKLTGKPTPFTCFLLKFWVLGVIAVPFLRFVPAHWLVTVDTEVVHNG